MSTSRMALVRSIAMRLRTGWCGLTRSSGRLNCLVVQRWLERCKCRSGTAAGPFLSGPPLSLMTDTITVIMPSPPSPLLRSHYNRVCSDMYHRPPLITVLCNKGLGNRGQHGYCSAVLPLCGIREAHPIACSGHDCMTGGPSLKSYSVELLPSVRTKPLRGCWFVGKTCRPGYPRTSIPLLPSLFLTHPLNIRDQRDP